MIKSRPAWITLIVVCYLIFFNESVIVNSYRNYIKTQITYK